jgi:mono/diheme cytochrome c family protein
VILALLLLLLLPALSCSPPDRTPEAPGGPAVGGPARNARPITAAERAGEEVYRREGCPRCHTLLDTPPPLGPAVLPGPPDVGPVASRVGPDLGLEGHRRSDDWQLAHLYAPDIVVPGSRMPASRHLFAPGVSGRPEPLEDALRLVTYLQSLGRRSRDVWAEFRSREPLVPPPAPVPSAERLRRGERLYARHCAACHGAAGDGRGPAAALFRFPPRDFTAAHYRFRSQPSSSPPRDADLFRAVTLGAGTGAAMPGFYFLPAEDRWALVLRVKEFSPALRGTGLDAASGPPPLPQPREAETRSETGPDAGRDLYERLGCGACHGPDGSGLTREEAGALWADPEGVPVPLSGDLTHACSRRGGGSQEAFARALLQGVGSPMPSYADAIGDPLAAAGALLRHLEADRLRETHAAAPPAGPAPPR